MRKSAFYVIGLVVFAATAFVLTVVSLHDRGLMFSQRELMRVGLEDTARRVRNTSQNSRSIITLAREVSIVKMKGLANLIEADPSVLSDQARLDDFRSRLDVDELHVSDGNGILIAGSPSDYVGCDLKNSEQSSQFLPAIHDKSFILVQAPQPRGLVSAGENKTLNMQYVGGARLDKPGVVQVGYRVERMEELRRMADVSTIAASATRRYAAKVEIGKITELPRKEDSLTTDCEGWRIRISPLSPSSPLASTPALLTLIALDLLALAAIFSGLIPALRREIVGQLRSLSVLVRRDEVRQPVRFFSWRLTIAVTAVFLLLLALAWSIAFFSGRRAAVESLKCGAEDCRQEIRASIDNILCFIGECICERYGSVSAINDREIKDIMRYYDVDEINVHDDRGMITSSSIGITGKDNSAIKGPEEFVRRLITEGRSTFAQDYRESVDEKGVIRKYVGVSFRRDGGFVQLGFDRHRLKTDYQHMFADLARGIALGRGGFLVSFREGADEIESCIHPRFKKGQSRGDIGLGGNVRRDGEVFVTKVFGELSLCYAFDESYRHFVLAVPLKEFVNDCLDDVFGLTIALAAVYLLLLWLLNRLVGVHASLKAFVKEDAERRGKDLATARTIQVSSLPAMFPDERDYRIFARMQPAREVGGDFFDFFDLPGGRVCVLIADVSGKGVPAAMFMMKAKTELRAAVQSNSDLATAVSNVNVQLSSQNDADMFVTAWIGCYDRKTGVLEYVCAGHNPPLIKRCDGSVEWVRGRRSLPLAAMSNVKYGIQKLELAPGDSLFLYTDGVTEAANSKGEFYGEQRLEKTLAAAGPVFVAEISADLNVFVGGAEQSDDITMLALDRKREEAT